MPRANIETFQQGGRWHNRVEGTDEVFGSAATKQQAVENGRARAKADKVDLIVRGKDGQVEQRISNIR